MADHRKNMIAAGRGFSALFRGEQTSAALVAGARLATFLEYQIGFFEHAAKRKR
jgi:hypothetical protein